MERTNKNDFVELEFIGKVINGEVFDTNITEEAEKIGLKIENKKFIICIGQKMVVEGLDKALEGKEIGKKYNIALNSNEAFGSRRKELIRLVPLNVFTEKKVVPKIGMTLALDNNLVRIASVSGGRVLVDFNNPLAGKEISYEFVIKRKITDKKEKINSLLDYFLKQRLKFEIKENKAVFETKDPMFKPAIEMLNSKFKEILDIELIVNKENPNLLQ